MNYELTLKLKETGFPLKKCSVGPDCAQWLYFKNKEAIHTPTLSELIEACGDEFHCLIHATNMGVDSNHSFWSAGIDNVVLNWSNGATPEEAVANLWLALNEKKS